MSSTTKSRGSAISGDDSIKSGGCVNSVCVDPTGEALALSIRVRLGSENKIFKVPAGGQTTNFVRLIVTQ